MPIRRQDRFVEIVVPRSNHTNHTGLHGAVDGLAHVIVRAAEAAQAEIRNCDPVVGRAVAVRIGTALEGRNDVRRSSLATCIGDFERHQPGVGSHAFQPAVRGDDAGHRCSVSLIIAGIVIVVDEIAAADHFEPGPDPATQVGMHVVDARIENGDYDSFSRCRQFRLHAIRPNLLHALAEQRVEREFHVGGPDIVQSLDRWQFVIRQVYGDAVQRNEELAVERDERGAAPAGPGAPPCRRRVRSFRNCSCCCRNSSRMAVCCFGRSPFRAAMAGALNCTMYRGRCRASFMGRADCRRPWCNRSSGAHRRRTPPPAGPAGLTRPPVWVIGFIPWPITTMSNARIATSISAAFDPCRNMKRLPQ